MEVKIAKQMTASHGELNTQYFKDAQFLNKKEQEALLDFIDKVRFDFELSGKNKPSWKDDEANEISGTERYRELNCWHYHSGPNYHRKKYPVALKGLEFNPNGDTSSEVIYYQKIDTDTIFIQAFSPKHEPFPSANSLPNPILDRTFIQKVAELEKILSKINDI